MLPANNQHRIKKLCIGSLDAPVDIGFLAKHHITHIINLSKISYKQYGDIKYLDLPIDDEIGAKIDDKFVIAIHFIESGFARGGNVLVHCAAGISRSATIILAYLIKRCGISLVAANQLLTDVRPIVSPNPGFWMQLKELNAVLRPSRTTLPSDLILVSHEVPKSDADNKLANLLKSIRTPAHT